MHGGSKKKYFRYFDKGRILAYFENIPKDMQELENVIYVKEIRSIEDMYQGKMNHFLIDVGQASFHLKCDDEKETEKWIKTIKYFKNYYQGQEKVFDKNFYEEVDLETNIRISAENE